MAKRSTQPTPDYTATAALDSKAHADWSLAYWAAELVQAKADGDARAILFSEARIAAVETRVSRLDAPRCGNVLSF